jgi:hypothetical protein
LTVELQEARDNVQKRLDFIGGEIVKLDDAIAKKQGESAEVGDKISQLQMAMQREAATAAQALVEN